MSLKNDLQTIDGVGEATASEILEVLEDHDTDGIDPREVQRAVNMLERGASNPAQDRLESLLD